MPVMARCFFLFSLAVCGCGAPSLPTVPVTGTVKYQGNLVEGATVVFVDIKPNGKSAAGITDAQGNFTLETSLGGSGAKTAKGALPGDYVVLVTKAAGPGEGQGGPDEQHPEVTGPQATQVDPNAMAPVKDVKLAFPAKYSDPTKTDLKYTVKQGEKNHFDLELKD